MTWIAARGLSGAEALGRCTGISRLHFCAACGQPRKLLRSSSGAKSRGPSRVPASRPTTSKPAAASGSTATPPAPPRPMATTTAGASLVVMTPTRRRVRVELRVVIRGALNRLERRIHALLLGSHREPQPRIADELPTDEVLITAVMRIAERALERVTEHEVEESARRRREARGAVQLELREQRVLPLRLERRERAAGLRASIYIERRESRRIRRPLCRQTRPERAVDIAHGARFERAGSRRVGRNQPRDDGFERGGLGRRQICVRLRARGLRQHVRGDSRDGPEGYASAHHVTALATTVHAHYVNSRAASARARRRPATDARRR